MSGCWGLEGLGDNGHMTVHGHSFSFEGDENVQEFILVMVAQRSEYPKTEVCA